MGILRDLWNDPDPLKWFIFGCFGASLALGGTLYWQQKNLDERNEFIAKFEKKRKSGDLQAPRESLQAIADKADELAAFQKQVEDDPFGNIDNPNDDPANYASTYVIRCASKALIPDPKVATV